MFYKKIIRFLLFTFCVIFVQLSFAQKVTVINQKGTKIDVVNNKVTTLTTSPLNPQVGDIWLDNSFATNIITKVYDGTDWKEIETPKHTGLQGSVFFAGANGVPTENNSQLFWDESNTRLFIGPRSVNNINNELNVGGATRTSGLNNSDGTAGLPSYRFTDDSNTGVFSPGADQIAIGTGGIEALRIDASQNVSIGKDLRVTGAYKDSSGDAGATGQVLSSTATGTNWIDPNLATVVTKTANYTLTPEDNGKVFTFNSTSALTLTVPMG